MDREERKREEMQPLEEVGEGVSEGFEQAEEALIDAAEHGDSGGPADLDAFPPEAEPDPGTYGDADEVLADEDAEETEGGGADSSDQATAVVAVLIPESTLRVAGPVGTIQGGSARMSDHRQGNGAS